MMWGIAAVAVPPSRQALFSTTPSPVVPDMAGTKPNLAFMLIDDLGWSDTQFGGSGSADFGFISTPRMKGLESESVHFNRHYAYSWCAPSRSSLLSGRMPVHVNVNHSIPTAFIPSDPDSSGEGIPAGMTTIGTKLQSAGYKTHYVGKCGSSPQIPQNGRQCSACAPSFPCPQVGRRLHLEGPESGRARV